MIYLKSTTLLFLLIFLAHAQYPTANCPQLCAQNCTTASVCQVCYNNFLSTANDNSTCNCPANMYKDSDRLCKPCPVYCLTCSNYSMCTTCIPGYTLSNFYASSGVCTLNVTNDNGWVSINVTKNIAGYSDLLDAGVEDLVLVTNGVARNVTGSNKGAYLTNCTKLSPTYTWLGGYLQFGYTTKILKTIYSLPPHQWVNIKFQALLVDQWQDNTLLLELDTQENYDPNSIAQPRVIWFGTFDSSIRKYDLCGSTQFPDNIEVVHAWTSHNISQLKIQIRLNQSDSASNASSNLISLYFGIRELYVRVGTCGRNCKSCSGPYNCHECYPPYVAVNGSCLCDSSLGVGFPTFTGCSMNCLAGEYFDSTAKSCLSCSDQFQSCFNCSSTHCLSCNLGYFLYTDSNGNTYCKRNCPSGWTQLRGVVSIQGGRNVIRDECQTCPTGCRTCTMNVCILCIAGYQYFEGNCVVTCPIGMFVKNGACAPCSEFGSCLQCNSAGCKVCSEGMAPNNKVCWPICYVNNVTSIGTNCTFNCSMPCGACYGPLGNQCLSCFTGLYLDGNCTSSCPIGFYQDIDQCQRCPYGCESCQNASLCDACIPGYYFYQESCVRICPAKTYPFIYMMSSSSVTNSSRSNTTRSNDTSPDFTADSCLPCPSGCQRCLNAESCFDCLSNYYLFNFTCSMREPESFEWEDGQFRQCPAKCLRCTHQICTRCEDGWSLNQGQCVLECPVGKFSKQLLRINRATNNTYTESICVWKNPLCQEYDDPSDGSCQECSVTYPASVLIEKNQNLTICSYSCPEFFTKTEDLNCVPCPSNCRRCAPNMTCLKCLDNYVINFPSNINSSNLMNETCLPSVCKQGQFSDSLQCQKCPHGCAVCLLDGSCHLCQAGYSLDAGSQLCFHSSCFKVGQYLSSGSSCIPCASSCLTCFDTRDNCTACPLSPGNQTFLYNNMCVLVCPDGFFAHRASRQCRKCDPRCARCSDILNCTSCHHDFYLLPFYDPTHTPCIPDCPIGFWVNQTTCTRCYPDCKSCYGPSDYQCIQCYPNFYLDDGKCVYQCSAMKYRDQQSGHCEWCHPSCQECWGPTRSGCVVCKNNSFYYDHQCWQGQCPGATYLSIPSRRLCQPCQYGCQYCTSSQFCQFCTAGLYFYEGWCYNRCPGNLKYAISRYFNNLQGYICRSCEHSYNSRCLRCDLSSCKRCQDQYYLYRASTQQVYQNGSYFINQCFDNCPAATYLRNDGSRECVNCAYGCDNCISYSQCTLCKTGFNLVSGYCTTYKPPTNNCPSTCLTCLNSTNCTSCRDNYWLYYNPANSTLSCMSPCPGTFYSSPSGWCLKCPSTCVVCSSPSLCSQCISGYSLISGMCYGNSTTPCIDKCEVCTNGICDRCNSPYILYNSPDQGTAQCISSCPSGFYKDIFTCYRCNVTCASCNNTANNCTSCVSGLYRYGQSCTSTCPVGFYADSTAQNCNPCPSNCLTCDGSKCFLCMAGYYLYNDACYSTCPENTFSSPQTKMCFNCPSNCRTCADIQNCTSCTNTTSLFNSTCLEECPLGTYLTRDSTTSLCLPCVAPCYSCSSSSSCFSCIGGYMLNGTICQQDCSAGYYVSTQQVSYNNQVNNQNFGTFSQCLPCNVECATCSGSARNCITCSNGFVLSSGSCVTSCPFSTVNVDNICTNCPSLCYQCSNSYTCDACVSTAVLFGAKCLMNCPSGYFSALVTNSTISVASYNCTICSQNCQSCNGRSQYNCLSCKEGYFFTDNMCLNSCPSGSYPSRATRACTPCPTACAQCTSFSNCSVCVQNFYLTGTNQCSANSTTTCNASFCMVCLPGSTQACEKCISGYNLLNQSCLSSCPERTYAFNGYCKPCSTNCTNCGATGCSSCQNGSYLYQGSCYQSCPSGTVIYQGVCNPNPCSHQIDGVCYACCNPYFLYEAQNICVIVCPAGTYQSGTKCLSCSSNCSACISSTSCTSCNNGTRLYQGRCVVNCPVGTYPADNSCKACTIALCRQCSNATNCVTCDPYSGTFLADGLCIFNCPIGTYRSVSESRCLKCASTCSSCLNSSFCLTCITGSALYQGSCLSRCPNGTYNDTGVCKSCPSGCFICTSLQSCSVCSAGYALYVSGSTSSCVINCPSGSFSALIASTVFSNSNSYQCISCFSPCKTCITSGNVCTSCVSGYSLQGTTCVSSCQAGYYPKTIISTSLWGEPIHITVCRQCSEACLTCSDQNTCTSCPTGFNIDASGNCLSSCPNATTYYQPTTRQCLSCSAACYTCKGPLVTDCLSCYPGYNLYQGSCIVTCPFGFYSLPTYICDRCNQNCAACITTATNCTVCSGGAFLQAAASNTSICSLSCGAGFFMNSTTKSCSPCHSSCLNCSDSSRSSCTACQSEEYLWQGNCYNTCPSATTATNSANNQQICQQCPSGCLYCSSSSTSGISCTQCSPSLYLINGTCREVCPVGTYASVATYTCVDCSIAGCFSCSFNSSSQVQCLACIPGYYLLDNTGRCVISCPTGYKLSSGICIVDPTCYQFVFNGFCLSACPTGTYALAAAVNQAGTLCSNCSQNCQRCSRLNTCSQCVTGTLLIVYSSTSSACVSTCPLAYYNSSGNCIACTALCLQCYAKVDGTIGCALCASGLFLLNTQCLTACPSGYFNIANTQDSSCLLCASQCATCQGNALNCTKCKNSNSPIPSCTAANCSSSQYLDSSGICRSCFSNCASCYGGNSYECTSCGAGFTLLNGQCMSGCPTGYVMSSSVCSACPTNCLSCNSSSFCTQCQSGYQLTSLGTCLASCSILNTNTVTYYSNGTTCLQCNSSLPNCLTCLSTSNGSVQCASCQTNAYFYKGTCTTSCPSGAYSSNNPNICLPCGPSCSQCTSSACTQCLIGTVLSGGACLSQCSTGSYISTTNGTSTCVSCGINCLTCTSSGCTICSQPYALVSGQCTGCISGYFWSLIQNICSKCSIQCQTCNLSSTNCTSCAVGYYQYAGTCASNCPSGYYSNSNGVCTACSTTNCSICPNNICSKCISQSVQMVSAGAVNCLPACPNSTYFEKSINTCITCSTNCINCTSLTACVMCAQNFTLYLGYCLSSCPSGFTNVSGVCILCLTGCKTCGPITNCTSCNAGLVANSNGTCTQNITINCSNGYYANSLGTCSQCYPSCQTCNGGSVSNCLSCFNGSTLSSSSICVQNCQAGYFYNSSTLICQLCTSHYPNCISCNDTSCIVCSTNYTLSSRYCSLTCPEGAYMSNQQCLPCSQYCVTCTSQSSCTRCVNGTFPTVFLYSGACYTSCPQQTFLNGSTCSPCLQTCLTCSLSASNCSSCLTPYSLYGNRCLVSCPNGTYSSNYTCYNCSSNCLLCSGSTSCSSCASGYYLINGTCRSSCVSGYYVDTTSNRCLECIAPCTQCTSRTICTACASPYNLASTTCISNCSTGSYYNSSLSSCINCSMANCSVCTATSCSSCTAGYYSFYMNGAIVGCYDACFTGYFKDNSTMNCAACYTNCQTCSNASYCQLCKASYYLLQVSGIGVNECVTICPLGYFQTLLRTCMACSSNCNECQNSTYCDSCQTNYYKYSQSSITMSCVSQCPSGYTNPTVISGMGQCIPCPSRCSVCADAVTCTQCYSSTDVIISGQCKPRNCLNCLICNESSNVCNECVSGYFLYDSGCTAFCPNGYYGDNTTKTCKKCMTNCLVCFSNNTCSQCITGYTFVESTASCENEGYLNFGAVGNMSGFTSNITQIMATVYVSTSAGPIAFGALSSTYGIMQVCQFMYLMQGSTGGNPELNSFLESLSAVSYSNNPGNQLNNGSDTLSNSTSRARLLAAISYNSSFLQTSLPIFLMMIGFVCSYFLVMLFQRYNDSCCTSCPNIQRYIRYICQFMEKRFKYIYVDLVMWISYLPFLYFSMLQLKEMKFDSGVNALSSLIAVVIITVYPLYPLFILRKLFDKGDNLSNYRAITLQLPLDPEEVARRPLCASFQWCPRDNPDIAAVEMSLSPYIDKVVRPVYNVDVPQYNQFKYFTLPHWRLAYAAIKYIRKFLFVVIVVACPVPATTLGFLVALSVIYMLYLIILKPKEKLYLILEIILEILILSFQIFMLIYVTNGGATVTMLSIVAHALGFALANSSLAIAIILNIMAYYTICCCIVDLVRHLNTRAEDDDRQAVRNQIQVIDEKDGFRIEDGDYEDYPEDAEHRDLQKQMIKKYGGVTDKQLGLKKKRGDDEVTEENDEDFEVNPYDLDEKDINIRSSILNKKKKDEQSANGDELPNLRNTYHRSKKNALPAPAPYADDLDKELGDIKPMGRRGDDECTEENDDDYGVDPFNLDEKELNAPSSKIDKKKKESKNQEADLPNMKDSYNRAKRRASKKAIDEEVADHTEEQMARSKLSNESLPEEGLLKERQNDKYKREVGGNKLAVGKGEIREPTDKYRRNRKGNNVPLPKNQQQSLDQLFKSPNARNGYPRQDQQVQQVGTHDRFMKPNDNVPSPEGKLVFNSSSGKKNQKSPIPEASLKERDRKKVLEPFAEFEEEVFDAKPKELNPASVMMKERQKKPAIQQGNEDLLFQDNQPEFVQRKTNSKKQENKFYKGSDDEVDIGEVYAKERQPNRHKRGKKQEQASNKDINAVAYDANTLKASKRQSAREFAQDDIEELTYQERKGQTPQKKPIGNQNREGDLEEIRGVEREKKTANKPHQSLFNQVMEADITESIAFGQVKAKKPRAPEDDPFEQGSPSRPEKFKEQKAKRERDNRLQINASIEESYDDVVNRNKQKIYKPEKANKPNLLDIEDEFEEVNYQRPASKRERSSSRNKDSGLKGAYRENELGVEGDSRDMRRVRNTNSQRLRKKSGALGVNELPLGEEDMGASQDSRRVSKIASKKKIRSGVLNIEDNSGTEDLEQYHL